MARESFAAGLRDFWDRVRGRPLRPRAFRPNGWTIEEVERVIRNQPAEWGYVFDAHGLQIVRRRGASATLTFSSDELRFMKDAYLVHNHPLDPDFPAESMTLSSLDLIFAVRHDLAEVRAVAGTWRFVLQRPTAGWPVDEDLLLSVYNDVRDAVNREFIVAVAEGRMNEEDRATALPHETIRRVAEWGRFTYRREHWPWQ